MSGNPFAWPIDWQALATLCTGLAAVLAAVSVARRQNDLRKDEVRVQLLEKRIDALARFRNISGEWWRDAKLANEKLAELQNLVQDIEILFDDKTFNSAQDLLKDTILQSAFSRHIELFGNAQNYDKKVESSEKEIEKMIALSKKLPALEDLLIQATKVGHIF